MKKILVALLALALSLCSFAIAEEMPVLTYDEAAVASVFEGDFFGLEDWGVQFMVPNTMTALELTEEQIAVGTVALFVTEGNANAFTISATEAIDGEGNYIVDLESLQAVLATAGIEGAIANVNGIGMLLYVVPASNGTTVMMASALDGQGNQLAFSFAPATDEAFMIVSEAILSTVMPMA